MYISNLVREDLLLSLCFSFPAWLWEPSALLSVYRAIFSCGMHKRGNKANSSHFFFFFYLLHKDRPKSLSSALII